MRCSDGYYYVVKFANNPQGSKILFNELLGSRLAALLSLPVAVSEVVLVDQELIDITRDMTIELPHTRTACQAGRCFGSRLPVDPRDGNLHDLFPLPISEVRNHADFLGMLVFDKWTCNTDGRQVVFSRQDRCEQFSALMIDQGFCFNSTEWNFPDSPLRGRYNRREVYHNVRSIDSFEPWLSRLESEIGEDSLAAAAADIPQTWYEGDDGAVIRLLDRLNRRRGIVRELLWSTWKSSQMFPRWTFNPVYQVQT